MTNDKLRILMLTHRVPYPPDRGDRIRSWNILRHLSQTHDVSLGCVSDEPICPDARKQLESVCRHVAIAAIHPRARWVTAGVSAARGRSLTEGLFWSRSLCRTLDHWAETESFDAVLVYCSSMLPYARRKPIRHLPRFVDLVDVDSQKFHEYADSAPLWKRAIYRTEANRVRRLERDAVLTARAVTLVSRAEAAVLHHALSDNLEPNEHDIHGIPNGVDTEYFSPSATSCQRTSATPSLPHSPTPLLRHSPTPLLPHSPTPHLAFVGVMNYRPNVDAVQWFAEEVWPELRDRYPRASLSIVGKHPAPSVLHLCQIGGIEITGAVPDVRPHVAEADIVIAPLRIARGIQNKVLEAMAMGRPVVASPAAATGIDAVDGEHLLIARTPGEWVEQIDRLCNDSILRHRIATAARQLVCENYTWTASLSNLDRLLEEHLSVECRAASGQ